MRYLQILIFLIGVVTISFRAAKPDPASVNFGGEDWDFPSTVQEAVNTHHLSYKPPGYYYKIYPTGMEVILDYYAIGPDVSNEYQPKEALFLKTLHSYVFRFKNKAGVYDSLRQNLELTYGKKFVLTNGIKDSKYAMKKEFAYDFLVVSPALTIGIKKTRSYEGATRPNEEGVEMVTVRFMYDLTVGKMGIHMGNY